jgi:hypothetical protein
VNPKNFVSSLAAFTMPGVFNPYRDKCDIHDLADAPRVRRINLATYLGAIEAIGSDTIWMGRDLGYRGGRRTGLALTDEKNLLVLAKIYPGSKPKKATRGPVIAERTAAEIWGVLCRLKTPPLLWNVFPFHPHEQDEPMTNRRFTSRELAYVTELNMELIQGLNIKRIICIGQDAAAYAESFGIQTEVVRHPSYGGVREFRMGMQRLYGIELKPQEEDAAQSMLF